MDSDITTPHLSRRSLLVGSSALAAVAALGSSVVLADSAAADVSRPSGLQPTTSRAWHLGRRASIAATPAIAAKIGSMGASSWIDWQLGYAKIADPVVDGVIKRHFPWSGATARHLQYVATDGQGYWSEYHIAAELSVRPIFTERVLHESMVEFLSDCLYVGASGKGSHFIIPYDARVLRPHALGKYRQAVFAASTHPAMLRWLDNNDSTKTRPNENMGRELLELHTVGTGAFVERDVQQMTLLLTGQTYKWDDMSYWFRPENHYVGPLTIMGFSHRNNVAADATKVLQAAVDYLCRHRSTAERISRRLAVRFVSDSPSAALVKKLADIYQANDTDLKPVLRYLLTCTEFWDSVGAKIKRPQEYAATMVRAARPDPYLKLKVPAWGSRSDSGWGNLRKHLDRSAAGGHEPRSWAAVNGFPQVNDAWLTVNGLRAMWNVAESVANNTDTQLLTKERTWGVKAGALAWTDARRLTLAITGFTWTDKHLTPVVSWLAGGKGQTTPAKTYKLTQSNVNDNVAEAVRLIMASPYMLLR